MRAYRLPFSLLLPALDLTVWVFLALIPTTLYYTGFLADAEQDHRPVAVAQERQLNVQPQEVASAQLEVAMDGRGHLLTDINMPGLLVELATSLGTSWPDSWHPEGLQLFSWRALVFPLYALPAWWFAGVALDALLGRRRVHVAAMVVAVGLMLFCALAAAAMSFGRELPGDMEVAAAIGSAAWAVLFAMTPLAWWRQRRRDLLSREA